MTAFPVLDPFRQAQGQSRRQPGVLRGSLLCTCELGGSRARDGNKQQGRQNAQPPQARECSSGDGKQGQGALALVRRPCFQGRQGWPENHRLCFVSRGSVHAHTHTRSQSSKSKPPVLNCKLSWQTVGPEVGAPEPSFAHSGVPGRCGFGDGFP